MGSLRMRLRVPGDLESGFRDAWSPRNSHGELRERQVCREWGQGIPGAFREFISPRSELNSYLFALGSTKSPAGEVSGYQVCWGAQSEFTGHLVPWGSLHRVPSPLKCVG